MSFIYTLRKKAGTITYCILNSDLEKVVAATGGKLFLCSVVSEKLLDDKRVFSLTRSLEDKDVELEIKSEEVDRANYYSHLANTYPNKTFEQLKDLGF
jgi:hypothetical protein